MLTDLIDVTEGVITPDICQQIIRRFEASPHKKVGEVGSGVDRSMKDSRDITISRYPEWQDVEEHLNTAMMGCLCAYLRKYPHALTASLAIGTRDPKSGVTKMLRPEDLQGLSDEALIPFVRYAFRPGMINVQGYRADEGGYPYWHCEQYPKAKDTQCEALHRVLLWSVYLNEEFEAGETEFLFQQRLVKPKTGAMILAPASFSHTHRGNKPTGGDKYIATSWVLFRRSEDLFPA
ncbi:2OG-Fe(II) oxygenase [Ahniella affigens]|uniref:2OG-Fe(II) oxygenase n=1 Tax=Ahniella affigens TaxID=2021234 RepID=A0A2P1PN94_9GAMM|nr:2OG-Fe(II) oxygenase [Ahniella affigens]AVP96324.1 2OG-Fe(II) oxygenase [Ahniella affigens]